MAAKNSTVKVTLSNPIKRGDKEIVDITLRKPNTGSLRGCSLSGLLTADVDQVVKILPRISDPVLTELDIEALDVKDLIQCAGEIVTFLT